MQLLQHIDHERLLDIVDDLVLLVLGQPDVELPQLRRQEVPIVFPGIDNRLVLEVLQHRVKRERLPRLLEDDLAHRVQELADVHAVEQSLAMLSMKLDLLLLRADLVALVVLQVAPVDHPKIQVNIKRTLSSSICKHRQVQR